MKDTPGLKKVVIVFSLILTVGIAIHLGSTSDPELTERPISGPEVESESKDQTVSSQEEDTAGSRSPAEDTGSDRSRTYRKFEEIYGSAESEPLVSALFDYAILSHRLDRGSESYREEYEQVRRRLGADDEVVHSILSEGQSRIPESWGVVRNDLINLVMDLKIPSGRKVEYLKGELIRNFRISSLNGEAHPDSLCVGTAVEHLSKVGTAADAGGIHEELQSTKGLSADEKSFIRERLSAYFPEVVARYPDSGSK